MARLKGSKTQNHTDRIREVICLRCGKVLRERVKAGTPKKFCSADCRVAYRKESKAAFKLKTCIRCGKSFMTQNPSFYCSIACAHAPQQKTEDEKRATRRTRERARRKKDMAYIVKSRMRSLVWKALRSTKSGESWQKLVGYTVDDLRKHLQRQFKNGMSWELFLDGKIHIDHKVPVAAFNITSVNSVDFKRCFALSNLQPLWAEDNIKKGAALEKPFQPSLI